MFFKQIPGNGAVKNQLQQAVHKEKLPHASLLLGAPGRAGLPLVRAIMAYIFCSNPQGADSCGTCENCQKTHHLTHPDIHFTIPTIGSNSRSADLLQAWREMMLINPYSSLTDWQNRIEAENKQFNINVLEVKDIIEFAGMKSYQGEEKFLVIWMADLLGEDGNRLLKMIEEPPSGMYIFLLAENRETILNTILSRCRMWVLDPFQDSEIQAYLESEFDTESRAAQSAAFQANGDLNAALKAMKQAKDAGFEEFVDWMRACYTGRPAELLKRADAFAKMGREAQKHLIQVGLNTMQAILTHRYMGAGQLRIPLDQQKPIKNLSGLLDIHQINQVVHLLQSAGQALQHYAHAKILYTHMSQEIHRTFHQ